MLMFIVDMKREGQKIKSLLTSFPERSEDMELNSDERRRDGIGICTVHDMMPTEINHPQVKVVRCHLMSENARHGHAASGKMVSVCHV